MICSRSVDDLRPDVAANVKTGATMCAAIGVPVGFACTYRDQEYQTYLHKQGKAPALVTFHGARLAFDIYIKIPGREYDTNLYPPVADIFKKIGFSWMWDIAKNEMCHFQYDAGRKYKNADILAGRLPPPMPLWEDDDMDGKDIYEKLNEYLSKQPCPDWAKAELEAAKEAGITDGTNPCGLIPRYQAAIMAHRAVKNAK
jgi:hypothetical protein